MKRTVVGEGKVYLLSGGGKVFTDIAARFCRSEKGVQTIAGSPYSAELVHRIIDAGHLAATEFDFFVFGVEGYSRVTEAQLIRKRMASYLVKSGRAELLGKREFSVVVPKALEGREDVEDFLHRSEVLYEKLLASGVKEEDARYIKPQSTEFRAIIGMNAHALLDWFGVRCCMNAQAEIRDMAYKMLALCKEASPDIFANAGPRCRMLGYCPELSQNGVCMRGGTPTKEQALSLLRSTDFHA